MKLKSFVVLGVGLSTVAAAGFLFVNATAPSPGTGSKDEYTVITETPGAIREALDKAIDYAADTARNNTLKNNMILYRRNGLPFRFEIPLLNGASVVLNSTHVVMDTCSGARGCNYRYRESMSVYSSTDEKTNTVFSNLFSRKENWFANDKPIGIDEANSVVTNSTVYETAYPAANGVAMISGTILQGAGFEFACDTSSGICAMEGATLSTADVMGFWSQFNKPTNVYMYFIKSGLTSSEAEALLESLKGLDGNIDFKLVDNADQEIFKVSLKKAVLAGMRMDNMSPPPMSPWNVTNAPTVILPDAKYHVHFWINSSSVTLPCVYKFGCGQ
jgi:hypothetical protein